MDFEKIRQRCRTLSDFIEETYNQAQVSAGAVITSLLSPALRRQRSHVRIVSGAPLRINLRTLMLLKFFVIQISLADLSVLGPKTPEPDFRGGRSPADRQKGSDDFARQSGSKQIVADFVKRSADLCDEPSETTGDRPMPRIDRG
jgi:hypothetical protein